MKLDAFLTENKKRGGFLEKAETDPKSRNNNNIREEIKISSIRSRNNDNNR